MFLMFKNGRAFQMQGEEQSKAETQKYDICVGKKLVEHVLWM